MIETNHPPDNIESLDARIDSLLRHEVRTNDQQQELNSELKTLLSTAEKVILYNKVYPGSPPPTTQQRLEILTAYRSAFQKEPDETHEQKRFLSLLQNKTFRWAAAIGVALLVTIGLLLASPAGNAAALPGSAGQQSSLVPLVILGSIAVGGFLYLLFRRKK